MKVYLDKLFDFAKSVHAASCKMVGETVTNLVGYVSISFAAVYILWLVMDTLVFVMLSDESPQPHAKSTKEHARVVIKETVQPRASHEPTSHTPVKEATAGKPADRIEVDIPKAGEPKVDEAKKAVEVAPPPEPKVEDIKTVSPEKVAESTIWEPLLNLNPVYSHAKTTTQKPRVFVIISNLGLRDELFKQLQTECQGKITVSFSPYTSKLSDRIIEAKKSGFVTLVDLPLESQDYPTEDTGPLTLITGVPAGENIARYNLLMKSANKADGLLGNAGDRLLLSEPDLRPILKAIRESRLFFIDPQTTLQSQAMQICQKEQLLCHRVDLTVDEQIDLDKVEGLFTAASAQARENGFVVVLIKASPVSITQFQRWLKLGEEQGLEFQPLPSSSIIKAEVQNDRPK